MLIERAKLIESLTKVLPGIDQKELVEQMTQFHFTGKAIVTYNDAVYVRLPFPTDFQCSVHAKTLYNLLKGLDTEKVKMELTENKLKINTVDVSANLVIGEGTEINDILQAIDNEIKTLKDVYVLPSDFLKGVELCSFSAFVKDIGGSFTCIEAIGKHIMSSDKKRFSLYEMAGEVKEMMFKATIAPFMAKYDLKLYSLTKGWIHFFEAKDGLVFSVRKYSGEYPSNEILAMSAVVKDSYKVELPAEVVSSLGFLNVFTEGQEEKHVKIAVKDGFLTLVVHGTKGAITKKIKIQTKHEFSFGIDPIFLGEILKLGNRSIEIANKDSAHIPMAYFRSKNFVHAIALFVIRLR